MLTCAGVYPRGSYAKCSDYKRKRLLKSFKKQNKGGERRLLEVLDEPMTLTVVPQVHSYFQTQQVAYIKHV